LGGKSLRVRVRVRVNPSLSGERERVFLNKYTMSKNQQDINKLLSTPGPLGSSGRFFTSKLDGRTQLLRGWPGI
jgi:hypothetical protein